MKKSSKKNRMQAQLLCIATGLLIFSCTGIESNNDPVETKVSYPPPVIVLLDTCPQPKITRLKDAPSPVVLPVLKNSGLSYTFTARGGEKIRLSPPNISKVASPEAQFVNFNTEPGLAIPE